MEYKELIELVAIAFSICCGITSVFFSLRCVYNLGRRQGRKDVQKALDKAIDDISSQMSKWLMSEHRKFLLSLISDLKKIKDYKECESYLHSVENEMNGLLS